MKSTKVDTRIEMLNEHFSFSHIYFGHHKNDTIIMVGNEHLPLFDYEKYMVHVLFFSKRTREFLNALLKQKTGSKKFTWTEIKSQINMKTLSYRKLITFLSESLSDNLQLVRITAREIWYMVCMVDPFRPCCINLSSATPSS